MLLLLASVLFPFLWMVVISVKSLEDCAANPFGPLTEYLMFNVTEAWDIGGFLRHCANSLFTTVVSVTGLVTFCGMAGYAFARLRAFPLSGKVVPVLLLPRRDDGPATSHPDPGFQDDEPDGTGEHLLPGDPDLSRLGAFRDLLPRLFRGLPAELVEAVRIDGASEIAIFLRIMLPLARPAAVIVAIIYVVWICNDFMWPLVYLTNNVMRTATLGMMNFQGQYSSATTLKTAALMLATLPPVIVFLIFRRQIQGGLVEGAVKS